MKTVRDQTKIVNTDTNTNNDKCVIPQNNHFGLQYV